MCPCCGNAHENPHLNGVRYPAAASVMLVFVFVSHRINRHAHLGMARLCYVIRGIDSCGPIECLSYTNTGDHEGEKFRELLVLLL
jgi:hypothetical protein